MALSLAATRKAAISGLSPKITTLQVGGIWSVFEMHARLARRGHGRKTGSTGAISRETTAPSSEVSRDSSVAIVVPLIPNGPTTYRHASDGEPGLLRYTITD